MKKYKYRCKLCNEIIEINENDKAGFRFFKLFYKSYCDYKSKIVWCRRVFK